MDDKMSEISKVKEAYEAYVATRNTLSDHMNKNKLSSSQISWVIRELLMQFIGAKVSAVIKKLLEDSPNDKEFIESEIANKDFVKELIELDLNKFFSDSAKDVTELTLTVKDRFVNSQTNRSPANDG